MAATLLILAACGNDGSSDPAAVVEGYVAAYNAGDVDAVVAFYVEDAVITGHPFATRTQGSGAIRDLMVRDIAASDKSGESYEVSNVQVKGDTVTWEHLWKSGAGIECVGTGNNAEVLDGKIASYTFAPDVDCS
jgi:ketosteroid isomerase-like protein